MIDFLQTTIEAPAIEWVFYFAFVGYVAACLVAGRLLWPRRRSRSGKLNRVQIPVDFSDLVPTPIPSDANEDWITVRRQEEPNGPWVPVVKIHQDGRGFINALDDVEYLAYRDGVRQMLVDGKIRW